MSEKIFILFFCTLLSINGLAQQWHFNIDILHAPETENELKAENLLIVNNAVAQPQDFGHMIKQNDNEAKKVEIDLDAARTYCLFSAAQTLEESEMFVSVSLLEKSQNTNGTFWQKQLLTQHQTDSLCKYYGVDAILSLEQLVIYDIVEDFLTMDEDYYAYLQAFQTCVWTLQYADGRKSQTFSTMDTLLWEGRAFTRDNALKQLPDRSMALLDMSAYIGEKGAKTLLPQWEMVDRYIYDDESTKMQAGLERFFHKDWINSIQQFADVYASPSLSLPQKEKKNVLLVRQAYCAANIAVAYEMIDNFKEAQTWAEKAAKLFGRVKTVDALQQKINMNYYISQIEKRL